MQQGQLVIELNERILPRLSVNAEYAALMNTSDDPEVQRYVKEKLSEARALIKGVHTRSRSSGASSTAFSVAARHCCP